MAGLAGSAGSTAAPGTRSNIRSGRTVAQPAQLLAQPLRHHVRPIMRRSLEGGPQPPIVEPEPLDPLAGHRHHGAEAGLGGLLHLAVVPVDQHRALDLVGPQAVGGHHPEVPGRWAGALHPGHDL
ncbi:MAG: hypothetical protein EBV32_06195, partial [Proteobacteria bacterium]|nr:hypothetical protein [Candidatus Fonsibacter lacus]